MTMITNAAGNTLTVTITDEGFSRTDSLGEPWDNYRYTFRYHNPANGRTLQVGWRCGVAYGAPRPEDGLASAFIDAHSNEDSSFDSWAADMGYDLEIDRNKAQRIYNACDRMRERLVLFFDDWTIQDAWDEELADR